MDNQRATIAVELEPKGARRIQVGCGTFKFPGYVNADAIKTDATDVVFDACAPWPFPDSSFDHVFGNHMFEHLERPRDFMRHAWHALDDGGTMHLFMPHGNHDSAMYDSWHVRPYYPQSFAEYEPNYFATTKNPQHCNYEMCFSVEVCLVTVVPEFQWLLRFPKLLHWVANHLNNVNPELGVYLRAIKSPETLANIAKWRAVFKTGIPTVYVKNFNL